MAGGSGTRFWPLSRRLRPKQLLPLTGGRPLVTEAVARLEGVVPPERILVITNRDTVDAVRKAVPFIPAQNIIGEPLARDTTGCIGYASALLLARDKDAVFAALPADQRIEPAARFAATLGKAFDIAREKDLFVTFGIRPRYPATGYGYIERGAEIGDNLYKVARFAEKPDEKTAINFLEAGTYYWNGGIFVWKAASVLDAIKRFEPDIGKRLEEVEAALGSHDADLEITAAFEKMKKISIDYSVLERAENVAVIPVDFEWDDLGSWEAAARYMNNDEEGNASSGQHVGIDTENCVVLSEDGLVGTIGLKDCIIVKTKDAVLVARRSDAEKVKMLVAELEKSGRGEVL
jgi:mannose-1-phosphate guanylyltransferase